MFPYFSTERDRYCLIISYKQPSVVAPIEYSTESRTHTEAPLTIDWGCGGGGDGGSGNGESGGVEVNGWGW